MDKELLGSQIKHIRKEKGLTQEKLSETVGITPNYLGEIERGVKTPGADVLARLAEALDVSVDYLLRNEVESGKNYIYDELTKKLECLTPKQRKTAADILDAYIKNLD
ncbi:MAG: helix-turn-helix transcriptional regulator [Clostridia bacterium]|nr:helix-turn-helix transcriptional regulator [Clostridia bacterium]